MQTLLLSILLLLSVAWLILRIRRNRLDIVEESRPRAQTETGKYHSVSLGYTEDACLAAKQITGRRFLSTVAPRLPLPECDSLDCRCQFSHHGDRRSGTDRRSPFTPAGAGFDKATGKFKKERRSGVERRKSKS